MLEGKTARGGRFGIATQVIALPADVIETIKEAQRKQDIRVADERDKETN